MKTTMSGCPIGVCPPLVAVAETLGLGSWLPVGDRAGRDGDDTPGSDDGGGSVLAHALTVTAASATAIRRRRIEWSLPQWLASRQRDAELCR
jgi:hypothetical protein